MVYGRGPTPDSSGSEWVQQRPSPHRRQDGLERKGAHAPMTRYRCLLFGLLAILVTLLLNAFFLVLRLPSISRNNNDGHHHQSPFRHLMNDALGDVRDDSIASIHHHHHRNSPRQRQNQNQQQSEDQLLKKLSEWEIIIANNLTTQEYGPVAGNKTVLVAIKRVTSCSRLDCSKFNERNDNKFVLYNPLDQPRILCGGKTVQPYSLLFLNFTDPSCAQQQYYHYFEPSTLFPVLPTRKNQRNESSLLPPIRLGIKGVRASPFQPLIFEHFPNCNVNCQYLYNNLNIPTIVRTVEGTNWEIATSMEGPVYYKSLMAAALPLPLPLLLHGNNNGATIPPQRNKLQHRFYATTSFESDIPLPYFSWDEYAPNQIATVQGVNYDKVIRGAVFIARNCQSTNQREVLVQNLIALSDQASSQSHKTIRIHSVSQCLHNHDLPPTAHKDDKAEIMNQYLFYLALENQNADDYVTEKLWGSLFGSGAVPIYFGAPNIREHVPPHSIIHVRDFPDVLTLWAHLNQVANNRSLYESYHSWREQPSLPTTFLQKYNFTHTHSLCRMCQWALAKKYGWGWNHELQTIEDEGDLVQKRKSCWDKTTGLLVHPFREKWRDSSSFLDLDVDRDHTMCATHEGQGTREVCEGPHPSLAIQNAHCEQDYSGTAFGIRSITMAGGSLRRTVWNHDGVLDISLDWVNKMNSLDTNRLSNLSLEIQLPELMADGTPGKDATWNAKGRNQFWLQDGNTRYTLLANRPVTLLESTRNEVLRLSFSFQEKHSSGVITGVGTIRFRFILEHLDPKRDKSDISHFANLMEEDFFNPIERFHVLLEEVLES